MKSFTAYSTLFDLKNHHKIDNHLYFIEQPLDTEPILNNNLLVDIRQLLDLDEILDC